MQFEMGISTIRYFPASGTAGFERSRVSGNKRDPAPPPMMTARVRSERDGEIIGARLDQKANRMMRRAARPCHQGFAEKDRCDAGRAQMNCRSPAVYSVCFSSNAPSPERTPLRERF